MANKHLGQHSHRIARQRSTDGDAFVHEDPKGLWVFSGGGPGFTIKWSLIRAALKRKDRK